MERKVNVLRDSSSNFEFDSEVFRILFILMSQCHLLKPLFTSLSQLSIPADGHGPEDGSCPAGDRDSGVDKTRQGLQIKTKLCSSSQNSWGSPWYQPSSGPGHVFCCKLQQEYPATNRYKLPAWDVEILSPRWSLWFSWWGWNKVQLSVMSWCDTVKLNISLLFWAQIQSEESTYIILSDSQCRWNFTVPTSCH